MYLNNKGKRIVKIFRHIQFFFNHRFFLYFKFIKLPYIDETEITEIMICVIKA